MDQLAQQVRRAMWRLTLQRFVQVLAWCWFGTLLAAAVLIGIDKFYPLGLKGWSWLVGQFGYVAPAWLNVGAFAWIWPALALVVGLAVAMVWTYCTRRSPLEAAIEIDRRFGLKERVSSSLSLLPAELETEAGRALLADAAKRVEQIHVADEFALRPTRWTLLPLAPAALAALLALLLPEAATQLAAANQTSASMAKKIKKEQESLRKEFEKHRELARAKGLEKSQELFEKMEKELREQQANKALADPKQSLVKLNNLAQDLEKRRQELTSNDKIKEQLNKLKPATSGPADKLADALKNGDMKQALKELDKLKDQLKKGELDDKGRENLAKQMDEMKQKLGQLAQEHQQAKQELERQIQEKRSEGKTGEAEKLQERLDKLKQADQQMKKLEQMAEKMGQCAECMKQGQSEQAMETLEGMKSELEEMQAQLEEMEMLQDALDEIAQCKNGMCEGMGQGKKGKKPGRGLGEGRGDGDRPEEETDTRFFDSNVKQKPKGGSAVVIGEADGPNEPGAVRQQIKEQVESSKSESSDPLTNQRLPREYRDHAKKYFDMLREGNK
ncbi:MAG: hypothetical protein AB7O62_13205 [Pirellulales bacterium]